MVRKKAHILILLSGVIWGSSGAFIKKINLPAESITFFRLAVPTIVLFCFFVIKKEKLFSGPLKFILLASLLNAVRLFFYFTGYLNTSIGNAVIMLYTWPIFANVLSVVFLKEKISRKTLLLYPIAFGGIVLAYLDKSFSFADKDFIGMSAILISSFLYSFSIVIMKMQSANYSGLQSVFFHNIVGALLYFPFLFANEMPDIHQAGLSIVYAFLIGIIGFGMFFYSLKYVKAITATFLCYIEVVSAIIFGIVIFNERLSFNTAVGGVCIIISTVLMIKNEANGKKSFSEK